ncbi:MAG: M67 family metallopeptidase [Pseudomonadota bacterium]
MKQQHIHSPASFPSQIVLPACLGDDIRAHCSRCYPHEACGLVLGLRSDDHLRACALVHCDNAATADKETRFEIAPSALFAAHRKARAQGLHVLGHYHSHPNGTAQPSQIDAASIADVGAVWIIISVQQGAVGDMAAFYPQADGDGFKPLALLEQHP